MILHIAYKAQWEAGRAAGAYQSDSLAAEGFIHACASPEQVAGVANRVFRGRHDLALLVIDPALLTAEVRPEQAGNGETYPHIYGQINPAAVVGELAYEPGPDGTFAPPAIQNPA